MLVKISRISKPGILYKADTNSLIIIVHLDQISDEMMKNNQLELYGTNDRIVFKTDNLLLQKICQENKIILISIIADKAFVMAWFRFAIKTLFFRS